MTIFDRATRTLLGGVIFTAFALIGASGLAAQADYRFELTQTKSAGPGKTTLTIRLVHLPDNKPVAGAVLFETKADMTPSGMADMTGKVSPLPSDQAGLYRLQVETGMAGKWQLVLGAKVQGEAGTVRGTIPYEAAK
jgi:hypothetical protein